MKTYIKFLISVYLKTLFNVIFVLLSLIFILNILTEVDFFRGIPVSTLFPIFIAFLNSPSLVFEIFPFIFLITTQFFFINLFKNDQINIFKYAGLKNSNIIKFITLLTFIIGVFIIIFFYNFSANLKNYYLELKFKFTTDGKYLAVITNNGLWIKDIVDNKINIINATKIENENLVEIYITQFDEDFNVIRNIQSEKIDISENNWKIFNPRIYENGNIINLEKLIMFSNFDIRKIQNLFSNLSSLSLFELFKLRKNYKSLNYSVTEVDLQISRIISFPFFFSLMVIFSSIIMLNTKYLNNITLKIITGLFMSVIIYYINNFFNVLGKTEKIPVIISVWIPLIVLTTTNILLIRNINEK